MEKKRHKHHRNHSPHEEHGKKKSHKRHYSEPSSEEEGEGFRRKHHKHKHSREERHRQRSGSHEGTNRGQHSRNHNIEANNGDFSSQSDGDNRYNHRGASDRHRGREQGSRHHRQRPRQSSVEFDPSMRIKQEKDSHNFREQQRERQDYNKRRREARRERDRAGGDHGLNTDAPVVKSEPGEGNPENVGKENNDGAAPDRQQPNFELSGKLTEDTNTFRGVVIKYNEPAEAMKPKRRWRLYPFKGQESLPVLHIHRQSAFLLGRDRRIADIPVDHPSCSKQQAVLQFRAMPYTRPDGTPGRRVRPYIIDLESANGTYLNGEKVEAKRYYELREKDVIKFGFSSREYVVLHDAVDVSEVADGEDMEEA